MAFPFISRLLSLFSSVGDPEAEKRRQLKQIVKDLGRQKFKFYKARGEEVQPAFAKFFYDLYRVLASAQVFLQNASASNQLKAIVIDSFLSKELLGLQDRLSEESIRERAKTIQTKELAQELKDDLVAFFAEFDSLRVKSIDTCYSAVIAFTRLVNFDYFFLLKKFDSNISERNFTYIPKFDIIRGDYIVDDVKDFLEIALAIDLEQDWKLVFNVLKQYKGVEVVAADQWNRQLSALKELRRSGVLVLMVRHLTKNPQWQSKIRDADEHITETYLQKLKTQTEITIQRILQEKRNAKIDELANYVFGTSAVARMKNYAEKANALFAKKMLGGYTQIQGMNYLKAFLLDYYKKDIRELVDLFLIRGQWSSNILSQQLSESFHELMSISERLLAFDDALADDADMGQRLRAALLKADRDKEQIKYVRTLLKGINDDALFMINSAAQSLIVVGKNLKNVLDDFKRTPRELIINWKEIELASEAPIADRITEVYKKIYYFIQLMQYFAKANLDTKQ